MTPAKPLPSDEERARTWLAANLKYYIGIGVDAPVEALAALLTQVRAEASQEAEPKQAEVDAIYQRMRQAEFRAQDAEKASQEKDAEIESLKKGLEHHIAGGLELAAENARLKEEVEGELQAGDMHRDLNRRAAQALGKPATVEGCAGPRQGAPMSASPDITVFVCGGEAAKRCPAGGEHDDLGRVVLYGPQGKPAGESVACSKCGSSAFDRDLLELP